MANERSHVYGSKAKCFGDEIGAFYSLEVVLGRDDVFISVWVLILSPLKVSKRGSVISKKLAAGGILQVISCVF